MKNIFKKLFGFKKETKETEENYIETSVVIEELPKGWKRFIDKNGIKKCVNFEEASQLFKIKYQHKEKVLDDVTWKYKTKWVEHITTCFKTKNGNYVSAQINGINNHWDFDELSLGEVENVWLHYTESNKEYFSKSEYIKNFNAFLVDENFEIVYKEI